MIPHRLLPFPLFKTLLPSRYVDGGNRSGEEDEERDERTQGENDGKFVATHFSSPFLLRRTFVRSYNRTNKGSCQ